jgi:hypothetical protein
MNKTEAKIRDLYRIPCGPMEISADSVCRRGLKDSMDKLLDRLTHEVHPVVIDDADGDHDTDRNHAEKEETDDERKERLIKEGKLRAEVKATVRQYEEELQGNSKLLQDISGKIEEW